MARFIKAPGMNPGAVLRVGNHPDGSAAFADFTDSPEYVSHDQEHLAVLRAIPGLLETDDPLVVDADLVDVRLPGGEILVPGAPRAGAVKGRRSRGRKVDTTGDRSDGGADAGQIVEGEAALTQAGLVATLPTDELGQPGADVVNDDGDPVAQAETETEEPPAPLGLTELETATIPHLRGELKRHGLDSTGNRGVITERLRTHLS